MSKVMMTVRLEAAEASFEGARTRLGLEVADLDPAFGLVPLDPDHDLYAVMMEETAVSRANPDCLVGGPFANPRIEPVNENPAPGRPRGT